MYWVNGQQQNTVDASDRAVQFGDGCFTTLLVENNQPIMLSAHIERLKQGCEALFLPFPDWNWLKNHIIDIATTIETSKGVIKVIISRGIGGRGYSSKGFITPTIITSNSLYPSHYLNQQLSGVLLGMSPILLGKNSMLAGIKHLNRLEQILIKHHLETTKFDDVLVCDNEGYLIEANASNLFWRKGDSIFTPNLTASGVNGIMRQQILQFAKQRTWDIHVVKEKPQTLFDADEVWLTNALMPIIPVAQIEFSDDKRYQYPSRDYYDVVLQCCLSLK
ncbi:aminodeoxychorismate lyase [Proteus hauseri ATCC 700826]|uniref:Aminodeoxychorismate lyase n=1 Tax=Proteus hauseri ATCC 700826 TaxID=1354271 RepID=A0AAJ3LTY8_PROHU|nr:aminodeoxychorismate lyase [Proteus hauseri]OAT47104.1 aminodeoxychorismate lyase [Proteus hauseri ATCC 700826]